MWITRNPHRIIETNLTHYAAHVVHHTSVTYTEQSEAETYIRHDSSEADGHKHDRCITCIQHTGYWVLRAGCPGGGPTAGCKSMKSGMDLPEILAPTMLSLSNGTME